MVSIPLALLFPLHLFLNVLLTPTKLLLCPLLFALSTGRRVARVCCGQITIPSGVSGTETPTTSARTFVGVALLDFEGATSVHLVVSSSPSTSTNAAALHHFRYARARGRWILATPHQVHGMPPREQAWLYFVPTTSQASQLNFRTK